ncbi:MAG: hypothetical protein LBU36_07090 [Clostridiales bacterium]|jgi:hypothetical protein|nr:hypothetical protein [Clostridiales bacterium]
MAAILLVAMIFFLVCALIGAAFMVLTVSKGDKPDKPEAHETKEHAVSAADKKSAVILRGDLMPSMPSISKEKLVAKAPNFKKVSDTFAPQEGGDTIIVSSEYKAGFEKVLGSMAQEKAKRKAEEEKAAEARETPAEAVSADPKITVV